MTNHVNSRRNGDGLHTVTIRNVPAPLLQRIKRKARKNGRTDGAHMLRTLAEAHR